MAALPLNCPDQSLRDLIDLALPAVQANRAWFVLAARTSESQSEGPLRGWKVIHHFNPLMTQDERVLIRQWIREGRCQQDQFALRHVARAGEHRVFRLRDLLEDRHWSDTPAAELMNASASRDRIVGAHTLSPDIELYFGFDRHLEDEDFSDEDVRLVRMLVDGLAPVAWRLAMSFGLLPDQTALAPRERDTLKMLLTSNSEKEIANEMGITSQSAHQYVARVYRKLKINSRAELMSQWMTPAMLDGIAENTR